MDLQYSDGTEVEIGQIIEYQGNKYQVLDDKEVGLIAHPAFENELTDDLPLADIVNECTLIINMNVETED